MGRNETIALEILDEIERARSGERALEDLERKLWRLLEAADATFPSILAGRIDGLADEIRALRRENLASGAERDVDEDRGVDAIYNEVTCALGRYLG